jgi:hypothetical protein
MNSPALDLLRVVSLVALAAAGAGSLAFMAIVGQRAPLFLLVIFAAWVLAPFLGLAWADRMATPWPVMMRATLYAVMLAVAVGSLAVYAGVAFGPPRSQPAFMFVVLPPASTLLAALALWMAARASRHGHA